MTLLLVVRVASLANSVDFTGYMVDTFCCESRLFQRETPYSASCSAVLWSPNLGTW